MNWDGIASLPAALNRDRPGLLGEAWFYPLLAALYLALVAGLLIWWIVRLRRGETLRPQRREAFLLVALALIHGLIYSVVNPPWFAPDEPSHFEYAQRLADLGRVPTVDERSEALHGEILASMYAFDYWRNNGMPAPEHAPVAFAAGLSGDWQGIPPSFVVDDRFLWYYPQIGNEPPLYYAWVQPAFWLGSDLMARHYGVRALTVLLYVASVGLIYRTAAYALGNVSGGAAGAAAAALFLPMFAYMGAAVNNDMAAAALGAGWFALAASAFLGRPTFGHWIGLVALALLSLATKKTALFLLPLVLVAAALYFVTRSKISFRVWMALAVGVLLIAVTAVVALRGSAPGYARFWLARPDPQVETRSMAAARDGKYGFRVEDNGGSLVQRLPDATLGDARGRTVRFSASVRATEDEAHGSLDLRVDGMRFDAPFAATAEWATVTLEAEIPAEAQSMRAIVRAESAAPLHVDALELVALDASGPGPNLLNNESAEQAAPVGDMAALALAYRLRLDGYLVPWIMNPSRSVDWALLWRAAAFMQRSFWGLFGSVNLTMPRWWDGVWPILSLAALVGLIGFVAEHVRPWSAANRRVLALTALLAIGLVSLIAQVMAPMLNRPDPNWFPQGRFLFPALAPIAILLYAGWSSWLPERARGWLLPVLFAVLFALDGVALWALAARIYSV